MSQQYTPVEFSVKVLLCGEVTIFMFVYFPYNGKADGYEKYEQFLLLLQTNYIPTSTSKKTHRISAFTKFGRTVAFVAKNGSYTYAL